VWDRRFERSVLCDFSSFRSGAVDILVVLWHCALSLGVCCPKLVAPYFKCQCPVLFTVGLKMCWGLCDYPSSKLPSFFQYQRDIHCTYSVRLLCVRVIVVAMETQQYVPFCLFILDVAVNRIKVFIVAMEMQQWVPFAPLSSCEIFRTAVDRTKY
jgi:hypothetical protein